ncbi:MAG: cardiolipin synthase [Pseudomonadota bacterium]
MFYVILGAAAIALQLVAIVFIVRSIQTARTPQGAVAWAASLFFLPFIAVPVYMFLGSWRYQGYVIARRNAWAVIEGIKNQKMVFGAPQMDPRDIGPCFEGIAGLPVVRGNSMTLLPHWQEAFGAMFAAIEGASDYVLVQFYIIKDDALGRELKEVLIRAAMRGVSVRVLYDAVGSKGLSQCYLGDLSEAGIEALDINRLFGPRSRFQINFRNHRKTVVVDGRIGFTGGFNVGDEYAGRDPEFGKWRDTHCALRGPMVSQLQLIFAEDWHGACEQDLSDHLNWAAEPDEADMNGVILATGPADEMDMGAYYFCAMIHAARERLWIATPYLIPENDVMAALKVAVLRGVKVRILLPRQPDHWATWFAAFAYFDELRDAGIEIWLYDDGFMHQKVMLVDDRICSVGTMNLDNRSCRLNFEATAVVFDKRAADATHDMLRADFDAAELLQTRLANQPRYIRYGSPVARLFAPLL